MVYTLSRKQTVPSDLKATWDFFPEPGNLKFITPDFMKFDIVKGGTTAMYSGQIIEYRVAPFLNIPVRWVTEITHVQKPYFFVDEQRFGPFTFWHHQHFFRETGNGVEVEDFICYRLPFAALATPVHRWMVRPRLEYIFDYRAEKIAAFFQDNT